MNVRLRKILRGEKLTPRTADEAAVAAAMTPVIVTISEGETEGTVIADKTVDELLKAYLSGKTVKAKYLLDETTMEIPMVAYQTGDAEKMVTFGGIVVGEEHPVYLAVYGHAVTEGKTVTETWGVQLPA